MRHWSAPNFPRCPPRASRVQLRSSLKPRPLQRERTAPTKLGQVRGSQDARMLDVPSSPRCFATGSFSR
jgi:hypothetical protein